MYSGNSLDIFRYLHFRIFLDILQEDYQKSSKNLNLFFVFESNLKKYQEPLVIFPNMLKSFFFSGPSPDHF